MLVIRLQHCLKGWVHQRPLKLPLGRNVDLANETKRLKSKFTMVCRCYLAYSVESVGLPFIFFFLPADRIKCT